MTGWQVLGWVGIADIGIVTTGFAIAVAIVFVRSAARAPRSTDKKVI